MLYSALFGKTTKSVPADAESVNAKLLTQGGFINKQMAGVYNYLPLGLRVLTKIQGIVRQEMNAVGGQEILMPALTQLDNYLTTGRDEMDVLFHLEVEGGKKAVLNPTHEEIVTPLVQGYTFSYRDLPVAVYQIQNKFRNEGRAKSGLLRGREFNMKDLYSFHTTEEDLNAYYEKMTEAYFKVYARLGLGELTLLTFASGGAFSKYSHEFQALSPIGEDTIYVCEKCRIAVNKEIVSEQNSCPKCMNVDLVEKKAIEVGNIFKLMTRFSDAFKFKFKDAGGKDQPVIMGCYGIGPSRLMGTIAEIFHDDKGIMWPEAIAPFRVHLVSLGADEEVQKVANQLYTDLQAKNIEVLFDDREKASAGEKLSDADLIGIPYRLVISKKTIAEKSVEFKKRSEAGARLVPITQVLSQVI
jgi:prolyl-tRNA synthetase